MKVRDIKAVNIDACVRAAQKDGVVLTRGGRPVAIMMGVKGMDLEQLELSQSATLWSLIRQRRKGKTISRQELESRLVKD